ncbi:polymer-forming cytoskeletal protein [Dokdonella sp.]|uniref:bactofilin family protein n=1 Tax=Dokdonella sp. TaxID=2291710 RepID=UPI002629C9C3|nr:polymer-forming cytoskeletal protein [Dokdonella sp.]
MFGSSSKGNGKQSIAAISTLIADGTRIRGDVHFGGGLHLEGVIDGMVSADGGDSVLTLSEKGRINGEVRVANAVINGMVKGDVFVAERLELAGNARIEGNVHYKVLEMAAGAQINGQMLYQAEARRLPAPALTGVVAEA